MPPSPNPFVDCYLFLLILTVWIELGSVLGQCHVQILENGE
ncbi:unnamed protein product, partial [Vitis vinifera]